MDLMQVLKSLLRTREGDWLGIFMEEGEAELGFPCRVCTSHWYQRREHPGLLISKPQCSAEVEEGLMKLKNYQQLNIKNGVRHFITDRHIHQ